MAVAEATAVRLGHDAVGTEHLLIGLLDDRLSPAAQVLNHLGVTTEDVRKVWLETTGQDL
jgi:ATP-dependent Clp protease ATP-binding subunit ClpC